MPAMSRCRTALIAAMYATLHAPLTLAQELPPYDAKALCDAPRLRMDVEKEYMALRQLYWRHAEALLQDESFRTFLSERSDTDPEFRETSALYVAARKEGRHFEPPRRLTGDMPDYPYEMIGTFSAEAMVLLHMLVAADGTVKRVMHIDHPDLPVARPFIDIAMQRTRNWTFSPTRIDGQAIASVVLQQLDFKTRYGYHGYRPPEHTLTQPAAKAGINDRSSGWGAPD